MRSTRDGTPAQPARAVPFSVQQYGYCRAVPNGALGWWRALAGGMRITPKMTQYATSPNLQDLVSHKSVAGAAGGTGTPNNNCNCMYTLFYGTLSFVMTAFVMPSVVRGRVRAPSSKSHTIRAFVAALLAEGESNIVAPLVAHDATCALRVCRQLGASVSVRGQGCTVGGTGGVVAAGGVIDVGNSGTTLRMCAAVASLSSALFHFDGDAQIRARPMRLLLAALTELGATVRYLGKEGHAPFTIRGPLRGGRVRIECPTSQYLTALLFATPCAARDSTIIVDRLEERPYIEMSLQWLARCGIRYQQQDILRYYIPGGQRYRRFDYRVEGDYSSATFFICAAVLVGRGVYIDNLWCGSAQGDRHIISVLRKMGARIVVREGGVWIPPVAACGDVMADANQPAASSAHASQQGVGAGAQQAEGLSERQTVASESKGTGAHVSQQAAGTGTQQAAALSARQEVVPDAGAQHGAASSAQQAVALGAGASQQTTASSARQEAVPGAPGTMVQSSALHGGRFDLSSMPDALPALMVCGCYAHTPTVIYNVAHARIKETDRIACMTRELRKMGARITEYPDGVRIHPTPERLQGTRVSGHGDHRIVMALAVAALAARGTTTITHAEAAHITYPDFFAEIGKITGHKVRMMP